jgi:hypothetical protein
MIIYLLFQGERLLGIWTELSMAFDFKDKCQLTDPGGYYYLMPYVLIEPKHSFTKLETFFND